MWGCPIYTRLDKQINNKYRKMYNVLFGYWSCWGKFLIHSWGEKGNSGALKEFSASWSSRGAEPATSGRVSPMWVRGTLGKFPPYHWKIEFRKLQWGHFLRCWSFEPSKVFMDTNRSLRRERERERKKTGHCSHSCHWHFPNSRSQTCLNVCPLFLRLCVYPAATIQ